MAHRETSIEEMGGMVEKSIVGLGKEDGCQWSLAEKGNNDCL